MNDDELAKDHWIAASTDVTALIADLDAAVELAGGDVVLAAAVLAKSFDEHAPGRAWLASRLAVALHMMNAATEPISEHVAQQIVDLLKEQL